MLIRMLLEEKPISNNELYLALSKKGNKNRNKVGGLGSKFHEKSRHALVSAAFDIDDKKKEASVKNLMKLLDLATYFEGGNDNNYQNENKQALCLALFCRFAKGPEHTPLVKIILANLAAIYREKLKKDDAEMIQVITARSQAIADSPALTNTVKVTKPAPAVETKPLQIANTDHSTPVNTVKLELKVVDVAAPNNAVKEPVTETALKEVKDDKHHVQMKPASSQDILNKIEIKASDELTPHEKYKNTLKDVKNLLFKMNLEEKDKPLAVRKKAQVNFLLQQIKNLNCFELQILCEYMQKVQFFGGTNYFELIRTERIYSGSGNTTSWQKVFHAAKVELINQLKFETLSADHKENPRDEQGKIKLDRNVFTYNLQFLRVHSGRSGTRFGETDSFKLFKRMFVGSSIPNQQVTNKVTNKLN